MNQYDYINHPIRILT